MIPHRFGRARRPRPITLRGWAFGMAVSTGVLLAAGSAAARWDWSRTQWDALFGVQRLLANDRANKALDAADALLAARAEQMSPVERVWLHVYRGVAHDKLGQRAAAKQAYRTALQIFPHPRAKQGMARPMRTLKHIEALRRKLPPGARFVTGRVNAGHSRSVHYTLFQPPEPPPAQGYPLILKVGHPGTMGRAHAQLLKILGRLHSDEPVMLAQTDVLQSAEQSYVDSPELLNRVPMSFRAVVQTLRERHAVDPDRIYLTGFSFDGMWAWMLGHAEPDLYAAIAPMSAASFPAPISRRVDNTANLPVCVLRGGRDRIFPQWGDHDTVRRMRAVNRHSTLRTLPGVSHLGVWRHADICLDWLLTQRRVRWPRRVTKILFAPEERSAYWLEILSFIEEREVDWYHQYAKLDARLDQDILSLRTANVNILEMRLAWKALGLRSPLRVIINGQPMERQLQRHGPVDRVRIDVPNCRLLSASADAASRAPAGVAELP